MKLIGLTGNMASGKSSVARLLINRDIPVVDVDLLSCICFDKYPELREQVSSYFGKSTINNDGDINHEILDLIRLLYVKYNCTSMYSTDHQL